MPAISERNWIERRIGAGSGERSSLKSLVVRQRALCFALALIGTFLFADEAVAQGRAFKDCADCPEMTVVPAGRFAMGADDDELRREGIAVDLAARERPRHAVGVKSFAIGRFEVTRGEYRAFAIASGRSIGDGCWSWQGERGWIKDDDMNWQAPGFIQDDRHPVTCVSWTDAAAYVAWLSARSGKAYRLPSEAEWEYAARAGGDRSRPWGDGAKDACRHENIGDFGYLYKYRLHADSLVAFVCSDGHAETAPVGSYPANAFGLHDMLGNVFEWTADCWNESHDGAPADGRPRLTGDCAARTRKGGSWMIGADAARPAFRDRNSADGHGNMLGFRVARDLP